MPHALQHDVQIANLKHRRNLIGLQLERDRFQLIVAAVATDGRQESFDACAGTIFALLFCEPTEGFRRGGMQTCVEVQLGKTYGEDADVIRADGDHHWPIDGL